MTTAARIQRSGRALGSLGLLMLAALIGLGTLSWIDHAPGTTPGASAVATASSTGSWPVETSQPDAGTSAPVDASLSAGSRDGDPAVLRQQVRLLRALTLTTLGGPADAVAWWILLLGLGVLAADRLASRKPRTLACGDRHGMRAPPVRS
jgi:hypothetical protein